MVFGDDMDVVLLYFVGDCCKDFVFVVEFNMEYCVG